MELKEEQNLILRITKYAVERKFFTLQELYKDLKLGEGDPDNKEYNFLRSTLTCEQRSTQNPNHILVYYGKIPTTVRTPDAITTFENDKRYYTLLPQAFYNYVDYLEIKEAKMHANEAKKQSMLAIQLTVFAILTSILIGLGDLFLTVLSMIYK
ncbi:MAG: hypothetical protein ABJH04_10845 [Cyclobacteriaceae bacterium]